VSGETHVRRTEPGGRLKNLRAVITGGSDGIGLAIASAFAAEGADLWLVARNAEKLAAAAESLKANGVDVRFTAADLTDPTAVGEVGKEIAETWDAVGVLVNNAGMARFTAFADVPADEMQAQVQLNLLSPYLLTHRLLPRLVAAQGSVINISSTSAHRLIPGRPASVYAMTKGGLNSLTKALALELGPQGVRVNAIAPGTIKTPLTERMIASFAGRADLEHLIEIVFEFGLLFGGPLAAGPGATLPAGRRVFGQLVQLLQAAFDRAAGAAEEVGNVLDAAVGQLVSLDGGIAAALFLPKRLVDALHPLLNVRVIVVGELKCHPDDLRGKLQTGVICHLAL
jgi:short-subunit dehydrogenase